MSDEYSDEGFQDMAEALMGSGQASAVPARFFVEPVLDQAQTDAAGRPVYVDQDFIEIRLGKDIIRRQPTAEDRKNYARQYDAFKRGQSQEKVSGTPLAEWPPITRGEAETLKAAGVRTVEQFAALPDTTIQDLGHFMAKRKLAQDWLKAAKDKSALSALNAENIELKRRVTALEEMLGRQSRDIEAARANGGSLPQAPQADSFAVLAEIRREMEALKAAQAAATPPPVRRGRKPKNGVPTEG